MIRPRSDGVIRLHGPSSNAARAARTARLMSSASPSAIQARVSPVAGLGVSNVLPDAEAAHCPLMNSCRGVAMKSSTLRARVTVMDAPSSLVVRWAAKDCSQPARHPYAYVVDLHCQPTVFTDRGQVGRSTFVRRQP